MLNLLFFTMGIAVLVMFVSPINSFIGMAMNSDNLNCADYVYNGDPLNSLSWNQTKSTDTFSCLALKLYLPYIVLVFLIAGVSKILYDRGSDYFGGGDLSGTGGL